MAAGKARSATAATPGVTPGVGRPGQEEPGDRGQHPGHDPRDHRDPAEPDPHQGGGLGVLGGGPHGHAPAAELEEGEEQAHQDRGDDDRERTVGGDADTAEAQRVTAPRLPHVEDVGADPPGELGQQDDVDADGQDRQADHRRPAEPTDQDPLGEQRGHGGADDAQEQGGPEAQGPVVAGDQEGAEQDQRPVHEADDLAGLEDDHEPEGDQGVDRPEADPVDEQGQELVHEGVSSWVAAAGAVSSPEPR